MFSLCLESRFCSHRDHRVSLRSCCVDWFDASLTLRRQLFSISSRHKTLFYAPSERGRRKASEEKEFLVLTGTYLEEIVSKNQTGRGKRLFLRRREN